MITPTALEQSLRRTLLTRAKNFAPLTALVPKANIDPDVVKPWPIIMLESPTMTGKRAACTRGADISLDVHAFAGPVKNVSGAVTMKGRDHIRAIGEQIETVFAPNNITLEDGSHCRLSFSDARILKDGDPDHFHWFAQLNCQVVKAVAA